MSEQNESNVSKHGLVFAMALLLLLPIFYVLSTGPVAWSMDKTNQFGGLIPKAVVVDFYSPVIWLHEDAFLHDPLDRYWRIWGV